MGVQETRRVFLGSVSRLGAGVVLAPLAVTACESTGSSIKLNPQATIDAAVQATVTVLKPPERPEDSWSTFRSEKIPLTFRHPHGGKLMPIVEEPEDGYGDGYGDFYIEANILHPTLLSNGDQAFAYLTAVFKNNKGETLHGLTEGIFNIYEHSLRNMSLEQEQREEILSVVDMAVGGRKQNGRLFVFPMNDYFGSIAMYVFLEGNRDYTLYTSLFIPDREENLWPIVYVGEHPEMRKELEALRKQQLQDFKRILGTVRFLER